MNAEKFYDILNGIEENARDMKTFNHLHTLTDGLSELYDLAEEPKEKFAVIMKEWDKGNYSALYDRLKNMYYFLIALIQECDLYNLTKLHIEHRIACYLDSCIVLHDRALTEFKEELKKEED